MTCRNQPVVSCSHQRRRMVQWVAAGVVLPAWAATAQAQMALSAAINVSGSFRALSQRMAKAYCQQHLQVMPLAALDVHQPDHILPIRGIGRLLVELERIAC